MFLPVVCFLYIHKWRKEGGSVSQQAEAREAAKYHFKQRTVPPFTLQRKTQLKGWRCPAECGGPAEASVRPVSPLKHHHPPLRPYTCLYRRSSINAQNKEGQNQILLRACSPYSVRRSSKHTSRAVPPDGKSHHEMRLAEKPQTSIWPSIYSLLPIFSNFHKYVIAKYILWQSL